MPLMGERAALFRQRRGDSPPFSPPAAFEIRCTRLHLRNDKYAQPHLFYRVFNSALMILMMMAPFSRLSRCHAFDLRASLMTRRSAVSMRQRFKMYADTTHRRHYYLSYRRMRREARCCRARDVDADGARSFSDATLGCRELKIGGLGALCMPLARPSGSI